MDKEPEEKVETFVIGTGSYASGKEKRAASVFGNTTRLDPRFLITKFEDGSVPNLLEKYNLPYEYVPYGYLGRARPKWTAVNALHLPLQFVKILYLYAVYKPKKVVVLDAMVLLNCLLPLAVLDLIETVELYLYVGDAPSVTKPNQFVGQIIETWGIPMIANSKFVKRRFNQLGVSSTNIQVVHNGIEWKRWSEVKPYDLRKRYDWSSETLLVGYAGQLIERKGIDDFISAAGQVLDRNPEARFVIMGRFDDTDPYHRQLQANAEKKGSDRIVFTGYVDEIERAYAALDIHVVPSRMEEPCGNVNLEAMAAGVPVIATDRGGNPELIVQGECGYLVEGESPSALATRILQLTEDASLRDQMAKNARQHVRKNFCLSNTVSEVEQILLHA